MATDQPSLELKTLDLFSETVIETVRELYDPIFSQIRTFGDMYDPVFVAKDVQEALGLKDLNLRHNNNFEWMYDMIKIKIITKGVTREVIALTEQGLYKAIWHSKTDMAKKFQVFMKSVMKELRIKGVVTLESAVEEYKKENERHKKEIKRLEDWNKVLDETCEREHKDRVHYQELSEHKHLKLVDQAENIQTLQNRIENIKDPDKYVLSERLKFWQTAHGRTVIVMINAPPKEYEETYDYDISTITEYETDDIDSSDTMLYSIGFTAAKSKVAIKKLYLHKDIKLDEFHKKLERHRLPKNAGGFYTNCYEISLDLLEVIQDDLNVAYENAHRGL